MEKADLVRRERDARCNRVHLTATGKALYDQLIPGHEEHMASRFQNLATDERKQLTSLLRKLDRNLRSSQLRRKE